MRKNHHATVLYTLSVAATLAWTPAVPAQAQRQDAALTTHSTTVTVTARDLDAARKRFNRLSETKQKAVLDAVRAAALGVDHPWLHSLEGFRAAGTSSGKPRYKGLRVGRRGAKSETAIDNPVTLLSQLPFHPRVAYRFAYGDFVAQTPAGLKKRSSSRTRRLAARNGELDDLFAGFAVDTDLCFAALLRQLDEDRSMDAHAVFLDSWRNGNETFYDALARTAGTGSGVFCYDAMLSDWVKRCIPKTHPDRKQLIRSLQATQTAFYQTAATYRAHRSLREVIALTMVLPPAQRLPGRLGKDFQDNAQKDQDYSTRDVIELILAAHGGDVDAAVQAIQKHLPPLPATPWKRGFQPVRAIYAAQAEAEQKLRSAGQDPHRLFLALRAQRQEVSGEIGLAARAAFVAAMR